MTTLVEAGIRGGNAPKHKWTDDERDIVRRDYDGTASTTQRIADRLSQIIGDKISFCAVKGQAAKMGITQDKSPRWSADEVQRLIDMSQRYAAITIARRLHRSLNAVVKKSERLGLKRRCREGWFTKKEVCEILGVDHKRIQRYIDSGALKASYHNGNKPQKKGMSMWHVQTGDLITFIKNNAGEFLGRNVDLCMIVMLLGGDIE